MANVEEILVATPTMRILKNEQRSLEKIEEKAEDLIEKDEKNDTLEDLKPSENTLLQRRLSSHKSFEMEDIPDEPKKKLRSSVRRLKSPRERKRASRPLPIPPNPKYDYPIGKCQFLRENQMSTIMTFQFDEFSHRTLI